MDWYARGSSSAPASCAGTTSPPVDSSYSGTAPDMPFGS